MVSDSSNAAGTAANSTRGAASRTSAGSGLAALSDAALPVGSLREALPHLRRPFTPEAIKFKVQAVFGQCTGCLIVPYIDARLVVERLNHVCAELWWAEYDGTSKDTLLACRLTVDGVTRLDVGESPKKLSKDIFSDALKRAAVHFGVGVSIYSLPQIRLFMNDAKGRIETRGGGDKQTIVLTEHGHTKLREGYAKWLESHGEATFGPALDHGDVEGATADVEAEIEADEFTPEAPAAVDDEQGRELIAQCRAVYDEIAALGEGQGRHSVPPGKFNAWLVGAQHSHAELAKLVLFLEERKADIAQQLVAG